VRIAVVFVAAALLGAPSPHPSPRFGIVAFDLRAPVPAKLIELGVGLVRGSCDWSELEPARGVFRWDCADNVVVGGARANLRSYLTVTCTPAWANGDAGCGVIPDAVDDWYNFVAAFVGRYSAYRPTLGIWNEPNLTLSDTPDGRRYALLFVNASRARAAVAPDVVLAGPETSHHAVASGYFEQTIDAIRAAGAFAPQDVIAVHWYPDGPPFDDYLAAVHAIVPNSGVWLSETGLATADAAAQANFYGQMLDRFLSPNRPWWWTHVIFYRLWDGQACCTEAILTGDYQNKPAFDLYRNQIDALAAIPHGPRRP
jgi:hypothetical protein